MIYLSQYLTKLVHKIFILQYVYFMPLHVSSTCGHHQEVRIVLHSLWYHNTYRCDDTSARCSVGTLKHTLSASVHHTDLYFTCCQPRYTVRIFTSSDVAGLGTLYGPSRLHTLQASVHCTDLQFSDSGIITPIGVMIPEAV